MLISRRVTEVGWRRSPDRTNRRFEDTALVLRTTALGPQRRVTLGRNQGLHPWGVPQGRLGRCAVMSRSNSATVSPMERLVLSITCAVEARSMHHA
jgi:hypothetical protein